MDRITNGNANSDQGIRYNFGYDSNDHLEGTRGSGLYLLAGNMSLYNLTLANNNGDDIFRNRGLYSPENTSLVLDNCEFLKSDILEGSSLSLDQTNRVDIFTETIDSKSSQVSLNNCNFVNNKKNHGFLIQNGNNEGNITLELLNCKFSGHSKNGIHYEKTGYYVNDTIKLTNCEFLNNSGKGLYYYTPKLGKTLPVLSLENCLFHNNSGGGIYFEREDYYYDDLSNLNDFAIALSNCQFVDNNASFGAGIYSNSHSMSVSNCLFEGNLAVGEYESTGGLGGAIYCNYQSTLEISDCNFSRNHADFSGGGIYSSTGNSVGFDTALILENSNFINNTSNDGGALHFHQPGAYDNEWNNLYSHTNIIKCNFYDNLATNIGGGIYCEYSNSMLIKQSIFQNNRSENHGAGIHGKIHITDQNSSLTLSECTFIDNNVTGQMGAGGGLYFSAHEKNLFVSDIINCIFFNNRSYGTGSAISIASDFSNLNFTNNTFVKNHNSGGMLTRGGAIDLNGYERTSVSFVNCISWKNFQQGLSSLGEEKRNEWHGIVGAVMKKASGETNIFQGEFGDLDTNFNSLIDSSELMALNDSSMQLDPLFVNIDDPIGPDGVWFTADDGLRLHKGSPGIDSGTDIDASVQHDITGSLRRQGDAVDIGI